MLHTRIIKLFVLLFTCWQTASAQLPNTNVYLFDMKYSEEGQLKLANPKYLTGFNPDGYNNQPFFFSDNELYLTVQMPSDTSQTDIYSLNIATNTITQITETAESEYSPSLQPNYYYFSAVRVEKDASKTQRLWTFPIDRMAPGKPLFQFIRNVGYHCWVTTQEVALYIVGDPSLLLMVDAKDGAQERVTINIGRCLQRMPNGHLAFVKKEKPDSWMLMDYDPKTKDYESLIQTLPGSEDFVVLKNGNFLMAQGSRIYQFNPDKEEGWKLVVDLRYYEFSRITRMAVSANNRLAIVAQ